MKPAIYVRQLERAVRAIDAAYQRHRNARHRGIFDDRPATDLRNTIVEAVRLVNSPKSRTTDKEPSNARNETPPASRSARRRYR